MQTFLTFIVVAKKVFQQLMSSLKLELFSKKYDRFVTFAGMKKGKHRNKISYEICAKGKSNDNKVYN